jgi:hypothetical protein
VPCLAIVAVALAAILSAACAGGEGTGDEGARDEVAPLFGRPPTGPDVTPPTLPGGVELAPVDPASALVGDGIAYGSPLPSAQAAAGALAEDPGIEQVLVRVAHRADGQGPLAEVLLATLDGAAFFDASVLDAYLNGLTVALAEAPGPEALGPPQDIAGTPVRRLDGPGESAVAVWRRGDLLVVVRGAAVDVEHVVTRSLSALAAGHVGSLEPRTPLPAPGAPAPFVEVPNVELVALPPPEEEPPPPAPELIGASAPEARIGVIGGERRAMVWAFPIDPGVLTVEAISPAVEALVQGRAGGAPAVAEEVLATVVTAADAAVGQRSARAFVHGRWVVLVEGPVPADLDGIVTAWLEALRQ